MNADLTVLRGWYSARAVSAGAWAPAIIWALPGRLSSESYHDAIGRRRIVTVMRVCSVSRMR